MSVWVVKRAGSVLYQGRRAVEAVAYMRQDIVNGQPSVTVTRNGYRIWPDPEQLPLVD